MAIVRTPGALTRTKILYPPMSEGLELTVKYADNRAVLARQNLFDTVRYINRDETGETITERKFPMGDLRIATVSLVLIGWNLAPAEDARPFPITEANILDLLSPDELMWTYDQIIAMNPVWGGSEGEAD